jgi:hypothetical protein
MAINFLIVHTTTLYTDENWESFPWQVTITCKHIHIFTYLLNRMQNTKHYCSRAGPSHSWNRLIYKLLIVSPNSAKNLNTKSLGSSLTIQRWHIKVIFLNTTWPLGEIPDRNKICHRNISKWMLYWSRGRQTVAERSDCNNFELNTFTPYIPYWKPLYVDYMQISIQAVAILSPISGTEQYRILSLHII